MPGGLIKVALRALDGLAQVTGREPQTAEHLRTGRRGEEAAYFFLRRAGYTIVARNWRSPRRRSELDLVAWDGDVLCFVEVKTRSTREVKPAEAAVDEAKQQDLSAVAGDYLRHLPLPLPQTRCDVVSVYTDAEPPQLTLFKNAFRLR